MCKVIPHISIVSLRNLAREYSRADGRDRVGKDKKDAYHEAMDPISNEIKAYVRLHVIHGYAFGYLKKFLNAPCESEEFHAAVKKFYEDFEQAIYKRGLA